MKRILLALGIVVAGIYAVNAQSKAAVKLINHLNQVCGLSPDQAAKLQPVAEDYINVRKANKQQYANSPNDLKSANKENNRIYKAKLNEILTPDQQQKLKAYTAQKRASKMQGGQNAPQGDEQEGGGQQ
jgi:hypothetical protein